MVPYELSTNSSSNNFRTPLTWPQPKFSTLFSTLQATKLIIILRKQAILLKKKLFDEGERNRLVVPLIYAFTGCSFYVP